MGDPARLTPSAVTASPAQLYEAEVLDDAVLPDQEVRCRRKGFDERFATDPLAWWPYPKPTGLFYPKHGDRAVIAYPAGGEPVIVLWWPRAAEPDESF